MLCFLYVCGPLGTGININSTGEYRGVLQMLLILRVLLLDFFRTQTIDLLSSEIVECKFLLLLRLQRFLILLSFFISGVNLGIPKALFGWKMGGNGNKHQEGYITWCGEIVGLRYYHLCNCVGVGIW